MEELIRIWKEIKPEIEKKKKEFLNIWRSKKDIEIIKELYFCLLTPQSKAEICWESVLNLEKQKILLKGNENKIKESIKKVRFYNNKTKYIIEIQNEWIKNQKLKLIPILEKKNPLEARMFLVQNIKGLGMKEASHFLRNIGFYLDFAILDRYILRELKNFGVIENIPNSLSIKKYLEIEKKMKNFSEEIGIPMFDLDFVLWFRGRKKLFK